MKYGITYSLAFGYSSLGNVGEHFFFFSELL